MLPAASLGVCFPDPEVDEAAEAEEACAPITRGDKPRGEPDEVPRMNRGKAEQEKGKVVFGSTKKSA